jgi:hypothetical protein
MSKPYDLSKPLVALDHESTLVVNQRRRHLFRRSVEAEFS